MRTPARFALLAISSLWCSLVLAQGFPAGDALSGAEVTTQLGGPLGALGGPLSPSGASPVFHTGDPTSITWGPTTAGSSLTTSTGTYTASAYYLGQNATADAWVATEGTDMAKVEDGTAITVGNDTPPNDGTQAAGYMQGDYHQVTADDVDFTGDMLMELLLHRYDHVGYSVAQYGDNSSAGWELVNLSIGRYRFATYDGTQHLTTMSTNTATVGAFHLLHVLLDSSDSNRATFYLDGVAAGSSASMTIASAAGDDFCLGGRCGTGGQAYTGKIGSFGLWKGADLWSGGDQAAVVAARFAAISGSLAATPADLAPSVATRSSTATLRKCEESTDTVTWFTVDDNWPRREVSCGPDWNVTDATEYAGHLIEEEEINSVIQSEDLSTTWATVASTIDTDQQDDPFGNATLDDVDGTVSDVEHGVSQAVTTTAASWTLSAVYKPGNQAFAYIEDSTVTNAYAYFDSSDCQADTVGAAATARGVDLGGGLCRISVTFTATAASNTMRLLCAEADADKVYIGAAGDCSFGNVQLESYNSATSYVSTATIAVTRSADALQYLPPDLDALTDATMRVHWYAVSGTTFDSIASVGQPGTTNYWALLSENPVTTLGYRVYGSTTLRNAKAASCSPLNGTDVVGRGTHVSGGAVTVYCNGTIGSVTATPADSLTGSDTVIFGASNSGAVQLSINVWELSLYAGAYAPGESGTGNDQ